MQDAVEAIKTSRHNTNDRSISSQFMKNRVKQKLALDSGITIPYKKVTTFCHKDYSLLAKDKQISLKMPPLRTP